MLKRISVQQLTLGMHIKEFCGSWMEHPFWRSGFLLEDPKDIKRIHGSSIQEVWIDVGKGVDVPQGEPAVLEKQAHAQAEQALGSIKPAPQEPVAVSVADEIAQASRICAQSKQAVMLMFQEARMGKVVDTATAQNLVKDISASVSRNAGALISLARLKTADDYTYMHSVAVCAMMVALARQLGLSEAETRSAGLAGLLHDLGKAMMPMQVLNKPGKLTDAEFIIIKSHPLEGHAMLLKVPDIDPIALDVCLNHHEKVDGSGYPKALKADEISLFAKMGAVCDVYDAITSNRPYKAGWDPAESLRKMAEWADGHFDRQVFQAFVKSLGIYPIGSLVRLSSGRIAVVMEQTARSLTMPRVKVFFSTKSDMRIPPEIVDLSSPGCREKIASREDPHQWPFKDINELWSGLSQTHW
ncbi:MAG: HD-GYP domain-containing protein [Gammaproteobacteria bacterium]|jgi:putative nucleotidyltransferase with HDIG domain|nr:HD-GYP domain-containing protein [Gammaproteobacteria bacterium]MBU0788807.1 HD-GYP domain-containing protein [Gammaproteobacteria bacterium]MBU0814573.1 HD-GYP domain-containing protein [Gammaproteobacteria bacterium]MBU1786584.1 HD-GYP domain-containing protein [Gammaproteobacteria bacterium]